MSIYPQFTAALVLGTLLSTQATAERKYSEWGPPVNLGCVVNSALTDQGPAISKDGRSLYFGSNRQSPNNLQNLDIYVAQRPSRHSPWETPVNLGPTINTPVNDNVPSLSRDEHWLFFNSLRSGGSGDIDLWMSWREDVHDNAGWTTPINLGAGVNTSGFDAGASYFENKGHRPPLLFFNRGAAQATQAVTTDIWVAELQHDGTFGNAQRIDRLSSPYGDQRPSIRFDGLEIFLFSNRPGSVPDSLGVLSFDLWVSTRKKIDDLWSTPVNLGPTINTEFGEINPYISPDGLTLFFASNRPTWRDAQGQLQPACGGQDLYMTTRTRPKGKHHDKDHDDDKHHDEDEDDDD